MGFVKTVCKYCTSLIITLALICIIRTIVITNTQYKSLPRCHKNESAGYIELSDLRWQRFREVLRMKTVAYSPGVYEKEELRRMVFYIINEYPIIFKSPYVSYEIVNNYSLLIHVKGNNQKLTPYLLAGHTDVVPVAQDTWSVQAFDAIEDKDKTLVYGRGSLDDKANVIAHLNALEYILQSGFQPQRSFYLAYGHDEEVHGLDGARHIAATLKKRGVTKLHFILDEGFMILRGVIKGISKDVACIGVSEKGYISINISVSIQGGHSSMPEKESAIGILSKAITQLETNPMPGAIDDTLRVLFQSMTTEVPFPFNIFCSNMWLFAPLWRWLLSFERTGRAFTQTTTAVTIVKSGVKENVIPSSAWAVINHRVHPEHTIEQVIQNDKNLIADDRINLTIMKTREPHPISPYDRLTSLPYQVITDTIDQLFGNIVHGPAVMFGNTDTCHYLDFSEHIYRFSPIIIHPQDMNRFHGKDELLTRENFHRAMNFYNHLIRNADRQEIRKLSDLKQEL